MAQGQQIARASLADQQAIGQPFEVADAAQTFVEFGAQGFVFGQRFDGIEASVEALDVEQRLGDPGAQQARAHRRDGAIQRTEQTALGFSAANGFGQFEIAPRELIEHHEIGGRIGADGGDLGKLAFLRFAEIVEGRACRANRAAQVANAEAVEGAHLEMTSQQAFGVGALETPVGDRSQVDARGQGDTALDPGGGHDDFARGKARQFFEDEDTRVIALKLGDGEFARRDVGIGESGGRPVAGLEIAEGIDRHQIIGLVFGRAVPAR